eukprot:NODE_1046_length_1038_cov_21.312843_g1001_i0.p1 GENE.NODE_1046_length_1038_cov_21.312843_g1001_i0~~NODE_1046_length_1038_cov_21.312843_g1001_i0.p1  ORF type:complete len:222 (-),score=27.22 NODE_1046_length_1038_cov_21.312843_g1001_i0:323-988(-)
MMKFVVVLVCLSLCEALYFKLEGEMCFVEEIEAGPLQSIDVQYKFEHTWVAAAEQLARNAGAQHVNQQVDTAVHVTLQSPDGTISKLTHPLSAKEGHFSMITSGQEGPYTMCFKPSESVKNQKSKMWILLETDRHKDWGAPQSAESVSKMVGQVYTLKDHVREIGEELRYLQHRLVPFLHTCESNFDRVWVTSVIQAVLIVIVGMLQQRHLKRMLIAKKKV